MLVSGWVIWLLWLGIGLGGGCVGLGLSLVKNGRIGLVGWSLSLVGLSMEGFVFVRVGLLCLGLVRFCTCRFVVRFGCRQVPGFSNFPVTFNFFLSISNSVFLSTWSVFLSLGIGLRFACAFAIRSATLGWLCFLTLGCWLDFESGLAGFKGLLLF